MLKVSFGPYPVASKGSPPQPLPVRRGAGLDPGHGVIRVGMVWNCMSLHELSSHGMKRLSGMPCFVMLFHDMASPDLDIMLAPSACSVHRATSPPSTLASASARFDTLCRSG